MTTSGTDVTFRRRGKWLDAYDGETMRTWPANTRASDVRRWADAADARVAEAERLRDFLLRAAEQAEADGLGT